MPCSRGLLVAHFYRPPDGSQYLDPDFLPKFQDMMSTPTSEGKEIIILGDFNTDYNNNQKSKEFKESLKGLGFIQLVKQSRRVTKESSTLIDIIATNQNQNILKCSVIKTSLSDHDMVGCVRKSLNLARLLAATTNNITLLLLNQKLAIYRSQIIANSQTSMRHGVTGRRNFYQLWINMHH